MTIRTANYAYPYVRSTWTRLGRMRGPLLLLVLLLTACGPGGAWVWVQDLPKQPSTRDVDGYRLAIGTR